ncbi:MAG TPA: dehydrogenase, partial [Clostridiales bacterium]|nr:dehydrogenase [Clostridiales bacterium]
MRILIIGAVAAGTSAAAKARRNNEEADIIVYEKDYDISYSGCGMPYYIGGDIQDRKTLTPRDPKYFKDRYNVDVLIRHEVLSIDPVKNVLHVKNLETNELFLDRYDKLVISTGARAVIPPIKGVDKDHVFTFRTIQDMNKIITHIHEKKPKNVVVVGSGYVGLEACENFVKIGLNVTLVERLPQVTSGLDDDMAVHVQKHLEEKNVKVLTGQSVEMIEDEYVLLSKGEKVPADMVLLAVGVTPNT